jgi:hypothetical protein
VEDNGDIEGSVRGKKKVDKAERINLAGLECSEERFSTHEERVPEGEFTCHGPCSPQVDVRIEKYREVPFSKDSSRMENIREIKQNKEKK